MKYITSIILLIAITFMVGCSSLEKTTITKYNADGSVSEMTVMERDTSDIGAYVASADGNATTLSADLSKFSLGYSGWGLNWFSVSGVRVKAPVKVDGSSSAEALKETQGIIKATKTSIETKDVAVNSNLPPESETK